MKLDRDRERLQAEKSLIMQKMRAVPIISNPVGIGMYQTWISVRQADEEDSAIIIEDDNSLSIINQIDAEPEGSQIQERAQMRDAFEVGKKRTPDEFIHGEYATVGKTVYGGDAT